MTPDRAGRPGRPARQRAHRLTRPGRQPRDEVTFTRYGDIIFHTYPGETVPHHVAICLGDRILQARGTGRTSAAFIEPWADTVAQATTAMLDTAPDPYEAMVELAESRETISFGTGFEFQHIVDDGSRFEQDVRRCHYYDVLAADGAAQLTDHVRVRPELDRRDRPRPARPLLRTHHDSRDRRKVRPSHFVRNRATTQTATPPNRSSRMPGTEPRPA